MLYITNRLLFIHIPRSAGNTITRTLAREAAIEQSMICATEPHGPYNAHNVRGVSRHTRYRCVAHIYPQAADPRVIKIAVHRPQQDVFRSLFNLISRQIKLDG